MTKLERYLLNRISQLEPELKILESISYTAGLLAAYKDVLEILQNDKQNTLP